jgi:uncharacterized protein involved in exopolysaccharide biosynthesis
MSDNPLSPPVPPRRAADEIRILDLASVMVRQWRLIVGVTLGVALLITGGYLLWPKTYAARTVLLPSQDSRDISAQLLRAQLPAGLMGAAGAPNQNNQARVEAILRSRTLADSLIARHGYEKNSAGDRRLRRILRKQTRIERGDGGSVVVTVRHRDPEVAAHIAGEFPSLVNRMGIHLGMETALRKQEFLEAQLRQAHGRLEESEQRLMLFQKAQDAPEAQEQARRTVEAAALLQQQVMEQEVRVAQLRRVATPDNPELRAAVSELESWRGQLSRLTAGQGGRGQVFFSLRESPELLLSTGRLFRDFKKDETVYLTLAEALAEAQVSAKNDMPVVSVLDHAEVPFEPAGLAPPLIAAVGLFLGFCFGLAAAFGREYGRTARLDPANEHFFVAWDQLKTDVGGRVPRPLRHPARR